MFRYFFRDSQYTEVVGGWWFFVPGEEIFHRGWLLSVMHCHFYKKIWVKKLGFLLAFFGLFHLFTPIHFRLINLWYA